MVGLLDAASILFFRYQSYIANLTFYVVSIRKIGSFNIHFPYFGGPLQKNFPNVTPFRS